MRYIEEEMAQKARKAIIRVLRIPGSKRLPQNIEAAITLKFFIHCRGLKALAK